VLTLLTSHDYRSRHGILGGTGCVGGTSDVWGSLHARYSEVAGSG
jgi:hypothetical protein